MRYKHDQGLSAGLQAIPRLPLEHGSRVLLSVSDDASAAASAATAVASDSSTFLDAVEVCSCCCSSDAAMGLILLLMQAAIALAADAEDAFIAGDAISEAPSVR